MGGAIGRGDGQGQGEGSRSLQGNGDWFVGGPCAAFAEASGQQRQEHASKAVIRSCNGGDGDDESLGGSGHDLLLLGLRLILHPARVIRRCDESSAVAGSGVVLRSRPPQLTRVIRRNGIDVERPRLISLDSGKARTAPDSAQIWSIPVKSYLQVAQGDTRLLFSRNEDVWRSKPASPCPVVNATSTCALSGSADTGAPPLRSGRRG
jgi:hypothetical protein